MDRQTGKFDDQSHDYKCYAAKPERFPGVRDHRWKNYEFVKNGGVPELPKDAKNVRIHASGDFFNQDYFDRWLEVCSNNPKVNFWAYTKSLPYWIKRLDGIPDNLILTASCGGRNDQLISEHNLKHARVIQTIEQSNRMPIDFNDDLARIPDLSFCMIDNNIKLNKLQSGVSDSGKEERERILIQRTAMEARLRILELELAA